MPISVRRGREVMTGCGLLCRGMDLTGGMVGTVRGTGNPTIPALSAIGHPLATLGVIRPIDPYVFAWFNHDYPASSLSRFSSLSPVLGEPRSGLV
jgi:hypothetical protein